MDDYEALDSCRSPAGVQLDRVGSLSLWTDTGWWRRTVVADAEEDELAEVLLSGVVFERSHFEEVARSEAGTLPWAVGTIAAFAHDDASASKTEVPSPAQVYHATRVAIRLVRA